MVGREILPSFLPETGACHGAHEGVKKSPVGLVVLFAIKKNTSEILDQERKVHFRGAPFITGTAGEAGPDIVFDIFGIHLTCYDTAHQCTGGKFFAAQGKGDMKMCICRNPDRHRHRVFSMIFRMVSSVVARGHVKKLQSGFGQ